MKSIITLAVGIGAILSINAAKRDKEVGDMFVGLLANFSMFIGVCVAIAAFICFFVLLYNISQYRKGKIRIPECQTEIAISNNRIEALLAEMKQELSMRKIV